MLPLQKQRVTQAVRKLREALGESQQAFAARMHSAVRTIARYESVRPPHGRVLAELEQIALQNGRADLAIVFRRALTEELGGRPHVTSPEEGAWAQAIYDILRNRQQEQIARLRAQILYQLEEGLAHLMELASAGGLLSRTREEFEDDLRNLRIAARGPALYQVGAAAEARAKREGTTFAMAYKKELTPELYEQYEEEHAKLTHGSSPPKKHRSKPKAN